VRNRVALAVGVGALAVAAAFLWRGRSQGAAEFPADSAALAAAPPGDSLPTLPPRAASLTREDSLAIAAAINRKVSEQQAAARAKAESTVAKAPVAGATQPGPATPDFGRQMTRLAESLRVEIERAVLDSVVRMRTGIPDPQQMVRFYGLDSFSMLNQIRPPTPPPADRVTTRSPNPALTLSREAFAERAANMGPPRRVFVSYPILGARHQFLAPAVDSLVENLRRAVDREPRFVVIAADTVRQTLQRTRTVNTVARMLDVELFVSLLPNVLPDSGVLWQVTVRDLSAHPAFDRRITVHKGAPSALLAEANTLVAHTVRHLEEMDRAPRRPSESRGTRDRRP
jgi:hypothetical protein